MTANINLEDYEIDTDSNGNLVIRDPNDTIVMTHVVGSGWSFGDESVDGIASLDTEETTTGLIDYQGGGFTQEGQLFSQLALSETFNVSANFSNTAFGFGIISRGNGIGTALFEFERFGPRVDLIYDSQGRFTTTKGNSATTNIFYDANDELIVENEKAAGDSIRIVLFSE